MCQVEPVPRNYPSVPEEADDPLSRRSTVLTRDCDHLGFTGDKASLLQMGRQTSRCLRWASGSPGAAEQSATSGNKLGNSRFVAQLRSSASPDGGSAPAVRDGRLGKGRDGPTRHGPATIVPSNIRTIDDAGADCVIARRSKRIAATIVLALVVAAALVALAAYLRSVDIPMLEPKGPIASQEQHLIIITTLLSLFVVIPVLGLVVAFAVKYREGNTTAQYSPTLATSKRFEAVWWIYPTALIVILSIITWNSAHSLDP